MPCCKWGAGVELPGLITLVHDDLDLPMFSDALVKLFVITPKTELCLKVQVIIH